MNKGTILQRVCRIFLIGAAVFLVAQGIVESRKQAVYRGQKEEKDTICTRVWLECRRDFFEMVCKQIIPLNIYEEQGNQSFAEKLVDRTAPVYKYVMDGEGIKRTQGMLQICEDEAIHVLNKPSEETVMVSVQLPKESVGEDPNTPGKATQHQQEEGEVQELETAPEIGNLNIVNPPSAVNETLRDIAGEYATGFKQHEKQQNIDIKTFEDVDKLLSAFYVQDSTTQAQDSLFNVNQFMQEDMQVLQAEEPQILIYHTHSQEAFADSVPGDSSTSIVGVGDWLANILEQRYGYKVLHYKAEYDKESREGAYTKALSDISTVLEQNPSIQVVIDLHRDEMPEGVKLVENVDGRPTAKYMFFNGLSRTAKKGDIAYLYNKNLAKNLAFSFRMKKASEEYYPGLARKNYLKAYRYNMHLAGKYLLIELGAQNNTLEEAKNACEPLAHVLYLVLSGEE